MKTVKTLTISALLAGALVLSNAGPASDAATVVKIKENPDTFCNPVNISYRFMQMEAYAHRYETIANYKENVDVCIQVYKDEYWLFVGVDSGCWLSTDLINWEFVPVTFPESAPDINIGWAPATCVIGDTLYLTWNGGRIYKSSDPKNDKWEYVGRPVLCEDPAFLVDDDGRVYLYYGGGTIHPFVVSELDPNDGMKEIDGPHDLIKKDQRNHGFENGGENNQATTTVYLEGGWVIKHEGKYYYQYVSGFTNWPTYADGCYVSDSPIGPFTFLENSPISFKNTGFGRGTGHSSMFVDTESEWWRTGNLNISVNSGLERRNFLYRAAVKDGTVYSRLDFGDYPIYGFGKGSFDEPRPDWNLLSFNTNATASSSYEEMTPDLAFNEEIRNWWSAETGKSGEWLMTNLGGRCLINAIQINFADQDVGVTKFPRSANYIYRYLVEYSSNGRNWNTLVDKRSINGLTELDFTSHDYFEFETPVSAQYIRITNASNYTTGGKFAISGLRLFGQGHNKAPGKVTGVKAVRNDRDARRMEVTWNPVKGAEGYMVRLGTKPDALYIPYQINDGGTTADIRCLVTYVGYYLTVDAYNNGGVTLGTQTIYVPPGNRR
ncbi:MAG: family 43 glycosylhydrolase [Defluviitaleaceae bacterium]|nr:family 43 glycosylhydrolase [Defluviitaleaceae bacterium]